MSHALATSICVAVLLCAASCSALRAPGVAGVARSDLFPSAAHPRTRAAHRRIMATWRTVMVPPPSAGDVRAIYPSVMGAVPNCSADASLVFAEVTKVLTASVVGNLSDGIADLGGIVVDLQGGCYLLSEPWQLPQFIGNFHVTNGELRAASAFPAGGTLVQVGAGSCRTPSGQSSCNENVGFHGMTFDGAHIAGTTLAILATMGATLDQSSAVFGFANTGILIGGGHETMITETWVAAYFWSDPKKETNDATGIAVAGNDHYISNTIVFSARVGVSITGAANILSGVHTWNSATGNGGVGIVNAESQNRLSGVYLDFNDLELRGSGAQQTIIENSFFLGGAQVVFNATSPSSSVFGVALMGNAWYDTNIAPYAVVELNGCAWTSATDLTIVGTALQKGQPVLGPTATRRDITDSMQGVPVIWNIDFKGSLLFPHVPISSVQWFISALFSPEEANQQPASSGFLNATDRTVNPFLVTIAKAGDPNCQGSGNCPSAPYTLTVSVDQSARSG